MTPVIKGSVMKLSLCALLLCAASACCDDQPFPVMSKVDATDIAGRPVQLDAEGKLLPWPMPEDTGYSYSSHFLTQWSILWDQYNRQRTHYFFCCFDFDRTTFEMQPDWHWANSTAYLRAMMQGFIERLYPYTGDPNTLTFLEDFVDYELENGLTPENYAWARVPYTSANPGDRRYTGWSRHGEDFLEPHVVGEDGYAYARLYETTGNTKYLRAAIRCADALVKNYKTAEGVFYNYYVFDRLGDPSWVILKAPISKDHPSFPSLAAELPSVNWQEREIQDWFGLEAAGHPNPRRVALHDNWPDVHPLRKDFPLDTVLPPFEGERHVYRPAHGEGVFHIPVGPVHAGIIEPGHFNFTVAGEPILYLQLRMFYTHKGTEKLFENIPIHRAVFLAESISGDSAFSHGVAFCQAIERAAGIAVPAAGPFLRTIR